MCVLAVELLGLRGGEPRPRRAGSAPPTGRGHSRTRGRYNAEIEGCIVDRAAKIEYPHKEGTIVRQRFDQRQRPVRRRGKYAVAVGGCRPCRLDGLGVVDLVDHFPAALRVPKVAARQQHQIRYSFLATHARPDLASGETRTAITWGVSSIGNMLSLISYTAGSRCCVIAVIGS